MVAPRSRAPRGFTLVELMISVAIVGALASVAVPQFERAQIRTKTAERKTVMAALGQALTDTISVAQNVAPNPWTGAANPPGAPGKHKRVMDWTAAGWTKVPMIVQGDCYYSYDFTAEDTGADGADVTVTVTATGDLDGDGDPSVKSMVWRGTGYAFQMVTPAGPEDVTVF